MTTQETIDVGRVTVPITLTNYFDEMRKRVGMLSTSDLREVHSSGIVDTGATFLVIPQSIATELGLESMGETRVRYADNRTAIRRLSDGVEVEIMGRRGIFQAIIEPDRTTVLIGAIVLEALDLLVDCPGQRLVPRDPEHVLTEVE